MIMGFVIDIVLVLLLISILVRGGLPSAMGIFTGAIAVGLFSFLVALTGYITGTRYHGRLYKDI
jgi:hypothetical protein